MLLSEKSAFSKEVAIIFVIIVIFWLVLQQRVARLISSSLLRMVDSEPC